MARVGIRKGPAGGRKGASWREKGGQLAGEGGPSILALLSRGEYRPIVYLNTFSLIMSALFLMRVDYDSYSLLGINGLLAQPVCEVGHL